MTNGSSDQLDQIAALLKQSIIASDNRMTRLEQSMAASDNRMTRLEQSMAASNERLTKLSEKTDARFNQLVAEADANRKITFEMLSQMTALQEESRRLLDYLFGQQRNGNGNQPQP